MLANRVTLKDVKAFLPRVNCKIATNRLRELFQEVDTRNRNELGFDDFVILYHKLMFDQNVCPIILLYKHYKFTSFIINIFCRILQIGTNC